ncbi:hypothetical protein ABG768_017821 [Culter alburnus]|uniref:G-protein coupled receptors family 1 profile domain-containing protein n=1 Tax=Culter alburnus TaxID=194366 RepID=A0AAW1YSZ5_CULAL
MNRSLRSENRFMYMLSTCLSDICSGVSYYYVGVLDVRDYYDSPTRTLYIAPVFLGLSFMAILAAQADRYHAVSAPFKYSQRMTRNRTLLVILAYWLYTFWIVSVNNLVTVGRASIYLIIIVAMCFLIAWLPLFINVIVCVFWGPACYPFKNDGTDPVRILARLNAIITPLLYIRGCTALRNTLLNKVWRTQCCRMKGVNPQNVKKTEDEMLQ